MTTEPSKRALPWLTVGKLREAIKDMPDGALVYFEDVPQFNKESLVKLKPDPGIESNNFVNFAIHFIPASNIIKYDDDIDLYIIASFLVDN